MSSGTPTPTGAINRRGPFRPGERVQITDERGRITTITLAEGGEYHSHKGFLKHDDLIGAPEGTVIANTHGILYQALRPLYKDFVLSMPRGAAVVYPKDAAQIIVKADIFPARASSRPALAPVRCPSPCCVRLATTAAWTPSNVVKSSQTSPAATSKPCSADPTRRGS